MARSFIQHLENVGRKWVVPGAFWANRQRKKFGITRKGLAQGFDKNFNSQTMKTASKASRLPGKLLSSPNLGFAAFGLGMGAMSWDSEKDTFGGHMAKEAVKTGIDMAGFALASRLGLIGIIGYLGLQAAGISPAEIIDDKLTKLDAQYKVDKRGGITPIKKNERTMAALNQSMSLLGQRPRGFLGNEASFMHN